MVVFLGEENHYSLWWKLLFLFRFYLVLFRCSLAMFSVKRSSSKSISRDLSLQKKKNKIVQEKKSQLEWIRCHSCF